MYNLTIDDVLFDESYNHYYHLYSHIYIYFDSDYLNPNSDFNSNPSYILVLSLTFS